MVSAPQIGPRFMVWCGVARAAWHSALRALGRNECLERGGVSRLWSYYFAVGRGLTSGVY